MAAGIRRTDHATPLYLQKLAQTSLTSKDILKGAIEICLKIIVLY
jgi:hypothetical protein